MPLTPEEFHDYVTRSTDPDGRLPRPDVTGWDIFPFETDDLRVVPLAPPAPEAPRRGAGGVDCPGCSPAPHVWSDEHWRLRIAPIPDAGLLVLMLEPLSHHDLAALPDDRAAELGRLVVHLARAVEALPHVARAHVARWGDGHEHLHVFVHARPEGFRQLRGSCLSIWDDVLPPHPADVRDADARAVAHGLARSYGGTAAP